MILILGPARRVTTLVLTGCLLLTTTVHAAAPSWTTAGSMASKRNAHTATLLPDGRVLVAGGFSDITLFGAVLATAELYDPSSNAWTATGSMQATRWGHTATRLRSGKILVAGGVTAAGEIAEPAELYDPGTGLWSATGRMVNDREGHTALLLDDGRVLVVGGFNGTALSSAEIYDPDRGLWTATGSLPVGRIGFAITKLADGCVLMAGGSDINGNFLASAEVFDPASGRWSTTGSLNAARIDAFAVLLSDGRVLVGGGANSSGVLASTEIYDPSPGTWTSGGSLSQARLGMSVMRMPDGRVLAAGGEATIALPPFTPTTTVDFYTPGSGWTAGPSLNAARMGAPAVLLSDGTLLIAGGSNDGGFTGLASAERFQTSSADLGQAHAFPVPFVPSRGHSQITFTGLTSPATVRIFTIAGEEIRRLESPDGGQLVWDVRNSDGRDVASGVYLYLITAPSDKKTGKLMIIR